MKKVYVLFCIAVFGLYAVGFAQQVHNNNYNKLNKSEIDTRIDNILLEDLKSNMVVNLKENPVYSEFNTGNFSGVI